MASLQDPMAEIPTVTRPPLESSSCSFTDSKPRMKITYDAKHTHLWTIGEFSKKMQMENGRWLKSDTFSIKVGDKIVDWYVKIYPNGISDRNTGLISVTLTKASKTEHPVDVQFTFSIVDLEGLESNSRTTVKTFIQPACARAYGSRKLISHSNLKNLISDDTITIMCQMTIKEGGMSLVGSGASSIHPGGNVEASTKKYMEDMGNVFKAGKYTDVTIVCQGREFPCHKAILAGRSPVFEAMFSNNFKEAEENKVEVVDIDADTFGDMLIFMYSGKVENLKTNAENLMMAGDKYDLQELKQMAEESLSLNLGVDNVLDVLVTAYLLDATNLKTLAMKFIGENAKKVSVQKEWREKVSMHPQMMADVMDVIIQKK